PPTVTMGPTPALRHLRWCCPQQYRSIHAGSNWAPRLLPPPWNTQSGLPRTPQRWMYSARAAYGWVLAPERIHMRAGYSASSTRCGIRFCARGSVRYVAHLETDEYDRRHQESGNVYGGPPARLKATSSPENSTW